MLIQVLLGDNIFSQISRAGCLKIRQVLRTVCSLK